MSTALPTPGTPMPRAPAFLVTIYGDVAQARGGTLGMAELITLCADHGISDTLVRTAVSRLVAAGRLKGERRGRRSFYTLTPAGQQEFASVAALIYAPLPPVTGWAVVLGDGPHPAPWVALGPAAAIAPDRADLPPVSGVVLHAQPVRDLRAFAVRHWDLAGVATAYRAVIDRFAPLEAALATGHTPSPQQALALRLALVHDYRRALLGDPRLPFEALPPDWPGPQARHLFVALYLALADPAEAHLSTLAPATDPKVMAQRLDSLSRAR